jgi:hypothetical protein
MLVMFLLVLVVFLWDNVEICVGHVCFFFKFLNFIIGFFQSCFSVMLPQRNSEFRIPLNSEFRLETCFRNAIRKLNSASVKLRIPKRPGARVTYLDRSNFRNLMGSAGTRIHSTTHSGGGVSILWDPFLLLLKGYSWLIVVTNMGCKLTMPTYLLLSVEYINVRVWE